MTDMKKLREKIADELQQWRVALELDGRPGSSLDIADRILLAVLQALREPSEVMVTAAGFTPSISSFVWRAMIDATIKEIKGHD